MIDIILVSITSFSFGLFLGYFILRKRVSYVKIDCPICHPRVEK